MKFLLDTCVVSELIKFKPEPNVVNWVSSLDEDDLYLSVLTLGEFRKGIDKLRTSKKQRDLNDWFVQLKDRFKMRILSIDTNVSETWGSIQARLESEGINLPSIDCLIASSAIANGLIVATRNTQDIEPAGAKVFNPWMQE